jgi:hypothetical protein
MPKVIPSASCRRPARHESVHKNPSRIERSGALWEKHAGSADQPTPRDLSFAPALHLQTLPPGHPRRSTPSCPDPCPAWEHPIPMERGSAWLTDAVRSRIVIFVVQHVGIACDIEPAQRRCGCPRANGDTPSAGAPPESFQIADIRHCRSVQPLIDLTTGWGCKTRQPEA